ncbi:MAG TPA: SDR family oxidoreductase, partial [Acidimicrobiales bacterium]|nr:SDR family oxidoreductase [Acidimicrobiales bacterium]
NGKVAVVTGGANGIGEACARAFAREGAKVVVADLDADRAVAVAAEIDALPVSVDVSVEADIVSLVERATEAFGPIDLFFSNAGIFTGGGVEASDEEWDRIWRINFMAHVFATRAVLPSMLARGEGYLVSTASAAGLLTNIGAAPYAVTKHAAVALAEWLSVTHGDAGIKVSCLCPQGVVTNMLLGTGEDGAALLGAGALEPSAVADAVVDGVRAEQFLILPHPEVADYMQRRAGDHERWLRGMRRVQAAYESTRA